VKILIHDKMQDAADAPDAIKSPSLADIYESAATFNVTLSGMEKINCVGIGNTDATLLYITNGIVTRTISITKSAPYQNGLYLFDEMYPANEYGVSFVISHNGTYIGRVAIGEYRKLGVNPTMEMGFYNTNENRTTLSGQQIPGAGGYTGRRFEADVRYKITSEIYDDIEQAYPLQIAKGFPFFLCLDDEQHKLPTNMYYFYAVMKDPEILLQSSTYVFKYSFKFSFYESF
jgi:hypothetical protein